MRKNAYAISKHGSVWMLDNDRFTSVEREIAITAMIALGVDPDDFRKRDAVIVAISPKITGMLDYVSKPAAIKEPIICCVCGKLLIESVCYATCDLKHHWHMRCDIDRCKGPCALKH